MNSPRVWVDVITPKQVLFFAPIVRELEGKGCEVLATSRAYREVEPMAKMCRLDLRFVGERGGASPADQLAAATERQLEMIPLATEFRPDVAVSVASGVCARVAFGLRTRHVAINDSPHSEVAAKLSLPLSHHLLCPWVIPYESWLKYGVPRSRITRYRALDPAAWLKRAPLNGPVPKLRPGRKTITVRLEEKYAPYMHGTDGTLTDSVLSTLPQAFPDVNLVALCRYDDQLEEIHRRFGSSYIVPSGVVDGRRLLESTDLFIGMGGTMSAEAALLGVPTISAFQGKLFTEAYLKSVRLLVKTRDPSAIVRSARKMLSGSFRGPYSERAKRILGSMEDPVPMIADFLIKTAA